MPLAWTYALIGGMLIGAAASLMLFWNGRVAGVSGILSASLSGPWSERGWRLSFLGGLVLGGLILHAVNPGAFAGQLSISNWTVVLAGVLVGFGTNLGSGCTSGHGVCGISRFSLRSIVATLAFITSGVAIVALVRALGVQI